MLRNTRLLALFLKMLVLAATTTMAHPAGVNVTLLQPRSDRHGKMEGGGGGVPSEEKQEESNSVQ